MGAKVDEIETRGKRGEDKLGRAIETERRLANIEGVAVNTPTSAAKEKGRDETEIISEAIAAGAD